jgi:hypothetical protein
MELIDYLKALAARLMGRTLDLPPDSPQDPYSLVRHPMKRDPGGRSSAIALEEPTEVDTVRAVTEPQSKMP